MCLCGAHQAGVNRMSGDPSLGMQQDGLHVMWLRLEVAPVPRPKGSVRSSTCFQGELPPSLNGSSREGGLCHCPLSGSRSPKGLGSWSLLSPGRSCGLTVISHMLSSIDILPHTHKHTCVHACTHTQHTRRLFLAGHPSWLCLELPHCSPGASGKMGRHGLYDVWPRLLPSPVASLRLLGEIGRHSFLHTMENSPGLEAALSALPAFPGSSGRAPAVLWCCPMVTNGIKT